MSIDRKLDQLMEQPGAHLTPGPLDEFPGGRSGRTIDEPVRGSAVGIEKLLEPLIRRGATAAPDPKILPPAARAVDVPPLAPAVTEIRTSSWR